MIRELWASLGLAGQHIFKLNVYSFVCFGIVSRLSMLFLGIPEVFWMRVFLVFFSLNILVTFKLAETEMAYAAPWTRLDKFLEKRFG